MKRQKLLAMTGATITLASLFLLLRPPSLLVVSPSDNDSIATRSHSSTSSAIRTGRHWLTTVRRWLEERWSWKIDDHLNVGDSGHLSLSLELVEHEHTLAASGIDDRVETRPEVITGSITVTVSGPFDWGSAKSQTSSPNHPNPVEWSWVFTAKHPGKKIIQIALPAHDAASELRAERRFISEPSARKRSRVSSRFPFPSAALG